MRFIGRTWVFIPVQEGRSGGIRYRVTEGKPYAIPDTKGYLWKEASQAKFDDLDMAYYEKKLDSAIKQIEKFGTYEELIS
jgi:hypothetical protein